MPRACFCCGDLLSERQIARHRAQLLAQINAEVDENDGLNPDVDLDDEDDGGMGVGDEGMDMGDGEMDAGDGEMDLGDGIMDLDGAAVDAGDGGMDAAQALEDPFANFALDDPADVPLDPGLQHGVRYNPPVLVIHDWPAPDRNDELIDPEVLEGVDNALAEGIDVPDQDKDDAQLDEEPDDQQEFQPSMDEAEIQEVLEREWGDIPADWIELFDDHIRQRDRQMLKFLATCLRTGFSRQTWDELRYGACEDLKLPSDAGAWWRLQHLSGMVLSKYDCCVNSCVCFLGKYAELEICPYCDEPRRNNAGQARNTFNYTPLTPQLQALFWCRNMIKKLRYRAEAEAVYDPEVLHDVFDGEYYRTLRNTRLDPDDEYCFFDNPEDLALGVATDGFDMFKRRRPGHSTAWPIIILIYNLHPRFRLRLENVICVGIIPGPRQCKDINSFFIPLLEELLLLERGVKTIKVPITPDAGEGVGIEFDLRAFMMVVIGDIPAVSKMLAIKGHNGKVPCRTCYIQGVQYRYPRTKVYYVPLTLPGADQGFPVHLLPLRSHQMFLLHYRSLEALAAHPRRREALAQNLGINARPIFARLQSIDLAVCAPYDLMHLLFENLVPNMISHWTGRFKKLDQGTENYEFAPGVWDTIGELTAEAAALIPSQFCGTLPNIATDQKYYKAEGYAFWWQYIAPIVLEGRLNAPYYQHFLLGREIVLMSVKVSIKAAQIDQLEEMIIRWVTEYERYYYQHNYERLRTCPLTIHALLHIPYYLRHTGPLCSTWAFIMERFVGRAKRAVKNRYEPYPQLDNWVARRAQMSVVCYKYGLPQLARSTVKWRYEGTERLSEHEHMYEDFPEIILGRPVVRRPPVDVRLRNLLTRYFNVVYAEQEYELPELRSRIDHHSLVSYGRFHMTDDADRIRTLGLVEQAKRRSRSSVRDNSFIKLVMLPDENAEDEDLPDVPYEEVFYGRLANIYYVKFIEDRENNIRAPYILVRVKLCKDTNNLDAALPETPLVTYRQLDSDETFHILTVQAVVGRVHLGRRGWGIVDRSRDGARTNFRDDDDNNNADD